MFIGKNDSNGCDIYFQIIVRMPHPFFWAARHDFLSETGHQPPRVEVGLEAFESEARRCPGPSGEMVGFFLLELSKMLGGTSWDL